MIGTRLWFVLAALSEPALAPTSPVSGDATVGLVSRQSHGEVHLVADQSLSSGRLMLKVVVVNAGTAPASFGPADVTVASAAGEPIALVPRETILAEQGGIGSGERPDTNQAAAHAAPTMMTTNTGQLDTSNYTGGMGTVSGGASPELLDRNEHKGASADTSALDAALLKAINVPPRGAEGGAVVTQKLKFRRGVDRAIDVTVNFAGDQHRFHLAVPKN